RPTNPKSCVTWLTLGQKGIWNQLVGRNTSASRLVFTCRPVPPELRSLRQTFDAEIGWVRDPCCPYPGCRWKKGYDNHARSSGTTDRVHRISEITHACRDESRLWRCPTRRDHRQHRAQQYRHFVRRRHL